MCGRFAVGDTDGTDWADWLALDPELDWPLADWPGASWNIAPTQPVGIVLKGPSGRRAGPARWGLVPHWWQKPLAEFRLTTFNARSEEAAGKPMFRDAWAKRRCLIPAIGWYEWSGEKGAKQPWFITIRRNTPGFWFAGLWSRAEVEGEIIVSATILTTAAGEATRHLHPRSPVVLDDDQAGDWLSGQGPDGANLMQAPPDDRVDLWAVDRAVGQVRTNHAGLIEPAEQS
ncbi:MAG: SOS response-associated peptidase [Pseudomonadota bacterium]